MTFEGMIVFMVPLDQIKIYLLDMDGTFYLGGKIFDWSFDFLDKLKEQGKDYFFLTNNSSNSKDSYVKKLERMGLSVTGEKVISSGEATTIHLNKRKPGAKIYLVGTPVLEQEFKDAGFILTDKDPDFVVVGFDTTVTYEKLWKLCDFVRAGVEYICTHPDFNCPIEGGYMPDIGGIIAFVEACTGKRPDKIIGKPYHYIVDAVMEKLGVEKDEVAMVGDRLYTDIAMGKNSGITSILVLSGETTLEDLKTSDVQPDYTFEHLGKIAEQL